MEHITTCEIDQSLPTAVTLGNFDGIHLGHRRLISLTKDNAEKENLKSIVFTFSPHPMFLFKNKPHSALIMSPEEKKYSIEKMGIDTYIEYPFTPEFAAMEPEDFIENIIFEKLKCKVLVVGYDYRFGTKQKGDSKLLLELGKKHDVKIVFVPSVLYNSERVSSTRVRDCILAKDIDTANRLLTKPYFILGQVAQGKKLGRKLGYPTINIIAHPAKLFPPNGVYATRTVHNDKLYYGVTNVGVNPTVNGTCKIVETFLFDFSQVVYGETLKTYFFKWIRDEKKFPSVDDLQLQLQKDAQSAKDYFDSPEFEYWREIY